MSYHLDDKRIGLDALSERIEGTDLVPSRVALLDGLRAKVATLKQRGLATLADLRKELKTTRRLEALSLATGIDTQYLILLRREIEGYFPKPPALKAFDWLPEAAITALEAQGLRDAAALYEATTGSESLTELAQATGMDGAVLEALLRLSDLTRVQWVSPTTARMLVEAGYDTTSKLAQADAEKLCRALERVNAAGQFYKGKIGLRDIKRLIRAAGYVTS